MLDDLQWADWDSKGRLLVATRDGNLQVRITMPKGFETEFEEDLAGLTPDPAPSPDWARSW